MSNGSVIKWLILLGLCCAINSTRAASPAADEIDFARDIQPILSENCFFCHGPDAGQRKADLRLDQLDPKQGPLAERDGYSIIKPGDLDESVLVMRITSDDPETKMPPPKSNRKLSDKQIDLLQRWIKEGAKWGKHWSFEPPKKRELPAVKTGGWVRNGIDNFIVARLEKEGLKPQAEANKHTLIRRVTLDLTGLPPTPAEVDAFVKDQSPDAYEKVVDRLLASPHYGERMSWEWLDAARYSDTNGYQNDPTRTMWPWRDWVVKALNENMPFDQFATWQIAGDLLPGASQKQRLASAFNRNHTYNGEGGRIPEETRVENVMDRTETMATTFLGLTVGCARCHDHKYDPISQKEYYQLYALFNQCSETGEGKYVTMGNAAPVMTVADENDRAKLAALRKAQKQAEAAVAPAIAKIDAQQAEWEQSARYEKGWIVATPVSARSANGATLETQADSSVVASGTSPVTDVHEVVLRTDLMKITGIRIEAMADPQLPQGGPGRSLDSGNFVLTQIEATAVSVADPEETKKLSFATSDATYAQEGFPVDHAIDGDAKTGWAVWKASSKDNLAAIFRFTKPATYVGGIELRLQLHYESDHKNHTMGRFRVALSDGSALTPDVAAILAIDPGTRSDTKKQRLRDFYRTRVSREFAKINEKAAAAKKAADEFDSALPKVMVMDDATTRPTHILTKGAYEKHGEKVEPGVLSVLHPLAPVGAASAADISATSSAAKAAPTSQPAINRLDLAKWLTDPRNPLTARVIVNRHWQQFFGAGIVKTAEDFGVQGERPVHPELLDHLALYFQESKWDVKQLHRYVVTSATYRQSSKVSSALLEKDPDNRLLARGPRFRLPSIVLRDQALAASGLLVDKIGGPPVKPYQPPGVWEEATFGFIKYQQDRGENLYRRSLYTFWRRIVGPTEFFDTPSRTTCTVRPNRTNTPLHALTTLNSMTYIEAARNLAQRVMTSAYQTPQGRIDLAYRLVLGRDPKPEEQSILLAALDRLKRQYGTDQPAAKKLLAVGESKREEKLDSLEHAAYTALCLEILNLDETLNRE